MNFDHARAIVAAVLYEGYILYPYRPSSVKNRQRWTFGGVFPRDYASFSGGDPCAMQTECLLRGEPGTVVHIHVRFLHLLNREIGSLPEPLAALPNGSEPAYTPVSALEVEGVRHLAWEEAVEREVIVPGASLAALRVGISVPFAYPAARAVEPLRTAAGVIAGLVIRDAAGVEGRVTVSASAAVPGVERLTVRIENTTPLAVSEIASRDLAQRHALVSAHTLLGVQDGGFISLMDPPAELREAARLCDNQGTWPVLAGAPGATDTMLSSPIILYDHPEVAPESPGDLFDATEIDEILILRILTMTDDEKRDMAAVDPRARALLQRTEGLTPAELGRLHGRLREPGRVPDAGTEMRVGDRVRLRPRKGGDVFDIVLAGEIAIIEAIERDFENRVHLAVTLLDDPGRDMGLQRMPGHRFFFAPGEVERLPEPAS